MNEEKIPLLCPFCKGEIGTIICDDEGNHRDEEYENDPWSGLGFMLKHEVKYYPDDPRHEKVCPIATFEGESLGTQIYDTREEAIEAWNKRNPNIVYCHECENFVAYTLENFGNFISPNESNGICKCYSRTMNRNDYCSNGRSKK